MKGDRIKFVIKYFAVPLITFVIGMVIGFKICDSSKSNKKYPLEVRSEWNAYGFQSYPTMEADIVKGDTIFKDGIFVINKNIINVTLK